MGDLLSDEGYMRQALALAEMAAAVGETPVGAIVVQDGQIIGEGHNKVEIDHDPVAHAEILAIRAAVGRIGDWRLAAATLYVTKEPCVMCAGAIVLARLKRVVWGVDDPRRGGAVSLFNVLQNPNLNHRVEIQQGVLAAECRAILQKFFRQLRLASK